MPRYEITLEGNFSRRLNTADQSVNRFDRSMGRSIKSMAGFAIAGAVIGRAISGAVRKIADFEETASNLSAITGLVGDNLDFLKNKAIEMGGATTKSAQETLEAFKLIASAKPELLNNAAALSNVTGEAIALAEASGLTMPEAAKALTASLNQFSLSADQSSRVINVLAAGSKFAAAEIPDLTASLNEFGGVSESLNITLEESAAAVETLSTKGLKGARAGINLRNVFLKLGAGASRFNPKIVGLSKALDNLSEIEDDTTQLTKMFGRQNVLAAQTLIKQRERVDELTESLTGTNIAYEQQSINTNNLNSDVKRMNSAWDEFVFSVDKGDGVISRSLRRVTQDATSLLAVITKLNNGESLRLQNLKNTSNFEGKLTYMRRNSGELVKELADREGISEADAAKKIADRARAKLNDRNYELNQIEKEKEEAPFSIASNFRFNKRIDNIKIARDLAEETLAIFKDFGKTTPVLATEFPGQTEGVAKVQGLEDQVTRITSAAPKTFNINIAKFVENFTVSTETLSEGATEVKDTFMNMWIKMLADVQAVGGR